MRRMEEIELPIPRLIVEISVAMKAFKLSEHLTCIDWLIMQMKIIIILHVYLFFKRLIQTALFIIPAVFLN